MKTTIIAAVGLNNAIGKNNHLLWKLRDDMSFFKNTTTGHAVVTGRKNYESIPEKFRPLPDRLNIIVTRQYGFQAAGATVVHSLEDALAKAREKGHQHCFIIGGGEIYAECMARNLAQEMLISRVDDTPDADTFFPAISYDQWEKQEVLSRFPANERNDKAFVIERYTHKI